MPIYNPGLSGGGGGGTGDVSGPSVSINNNVAIFDGTTGKLIKDSGSSLSDKLNTSGGTLTGPLSAPRINSNRQNSGVITVVSAGGTTILTASSPANVLITGTLTQNVRLPDATTLQVGDQFKLTFLTTTTSSCGIQLSDGSNLSTFLIFGYYEVTYVVTNVSTQNGSWAYLKGASTGSVSSFGVARDSSGGINATSLKVTGDVNAATGMISGFNGNFASSIYTGNVTNAILTLSYSSTLAPSLISTQQYRLTLTGDVTTFDNPSQLFVGNRCLVEVVQDATGNRSITNWGWLYHFPKGMPSLTPTGGASDMLEIRVVNYNSTSATISIATPAVITQNNHGFGFGDRVRFSTNGTLPTGLAINTTYFVNPTGANTYNVATSMANLRAATYVATSGSQTGTHTATGGKITVFSHTEKTSITETLSANKTLFAYSQRYQFLNPGAVARTLDLPVPELDMMFILKNTGTQGTAITVRTNAGVAISNGIVPNGITMAFYYDGSNWQIL